MSIKEISAEQLAQLFHLYHEALAGDHSGLGNDSHPAWTDVSAPERKRTVAAMRLALLDLGFATKDGAQKEQQPPRQSFAEPGTAHWSC
jgi:hypothetical protein